MTRSPARGRSRRADDIDPRTNPHPDKHQALLDHLAEHQPDEPVEVAPEPHDPATVDTAVHPMHEGVEVSVIDGDELADAPHNR